MINKFKFLIPILALALLLPLNSCEDLEELNVDPNNPTAVPAGNLFTQAQFVLNNRLWGRALNAEWGMLMVQYWAQTEYTEEGRYDVDETSFNNDWIDIYANALRELRAAVDFVNAEPTTAELKANKLATLTIMEVHAWHNLTDGYGDIPYTQALNPAEFPLPAYDSQSDIYADLASRLRSAVGSIDSSIDLGSFGTGDIIYGGDLDAWKRLGNSLLLRIAMRMSNVDEAGATSLINGMTPGDLISDNSQNAMFPFSSDPLLANPLYVDNVLGNRDDFGISTTLVDQLTDLGDPRLMAYAAPTATGEIIGLPPTIDDATAISLSPSTSRPADAVRAATAPGVIIDAAEVHFMLAEAYERGLISGGNAADAYASGITASMNYWGIDDQDAIDAYIAANPYDGANFKESIGVQKWVAFYMNGPQAWAEWRRLGFPELEVGTAATLTEVPVRLPYPLSELQTNSTSLMDATSNPGDIQTRLWWDVD